MENNFTPKQALEEVRTFIPNTRQDSILVIEQALIEHEKQKQILEVLKNKDVDLQNFKNSCNCEDYNEYVFNEKGLLTEKEYDLLEEWLK